MDDGGPDETVGIVGPGVYLDGRYRSDLQTIKIEGVQFCAQDDEVLLMGGEQRIGVMVCGLVRRPSLAEAAESNLYRTNWAKYKELYTNDRVLVDSIDENGVAHTGVMTKLAYQSMKACVGESEFEEAAVGSARTDLALCINRDLSAQARGWGGLIVENVTVPNIILSPDQQKRLDQLTESRQNALLADQRADEAEANGRRQLAEEKAKIQVEEGKNQEKQVQQALTFALQAETEKARLALINAEVANQLAEVEARRAVINAQKATDLGAAEADLAIETANATAAQQAAMAKTAEERVIAKMYQDNPEYAAIVRTKAQAGAFSRLDKVFYIDPSMNPFLMIGDGAPPLITVEQP